MNKAAEKVSEAINGRRFATVVVNGKAITVYPPAIKVLCRAITWFSMVSVPNEATWVDALFMVPDNIRYISRGISCVIVGDVEEWERKSACLSNDFDNCTLEELKTIFEDIIKLIHVDDFFVSAALAKSIARMAAEQR